MYNPKTHLKRLIETHAPSGSDARVMLAQPALAPGARAYGR